MSKLSPYVRAAIDSGTALAAIVEEINLGQATVRIGSGKGARLTNLSVMGEDIEPGDEVIVDYAAGIEPIVRPITTISEDVEALIAWALAIAPEDAWGGEELAPAIDIGCSVNFQCFDRSWESGVPKMPLFANIPYKLPFNVIMWDPGQMSYPWSTQVTIKDTGYYLVHFSWIEPVNATVIPVYPVWQLPVKEQYGVFRVRILHNGAPIHTVHNRVFEDNNYNVTPVEGTLFEHFDEGDVIEMEVTLLNFFFWHYTSKDCYDVCYLGGQYPLSDEGAKMCHRLTLSCVVTG